MDPVSAARLPRLRPLVEGQVAVPAEGGCERQVAVGDAASAEHPQHSAGRDPIDAELNAFCRTGGLVYAAVVDAAGQVDASICTVGSRPPNESEIGRQASQVFSGARALGGEIGEPAPLGMNVQGARWGYSLDLLYDGRLLLGIFPSQALPAIVRASAQKTKSALELVLRANE